MVLLLVRSSLLALQCPRSKLSLLEVKRQDGIKLDSWNVVTTNVGGRDSPVAIVLRPWAGRPANRGFDPWQAPKPLLFFPPPPV